MARFAPLLLSSSYEAITNINANFDTISALLEKALMRDSEGVNSMLTDLDMNHFRLKNVAAAIDSNDAVTYAQATAMLASIAKGDKGDPGSSGKGYATRALLAARTPNFNKDDTYLTEAGYEGVFTFDSSNLSAKVAIDTQQIWYIAPASAPTGTSGAWVRKQDATSYSRGRSLSYGRRQLPQTIRTVRKNLATIHTEIVGYAGAASVTGGFGYSQYYVNNASFDTSVPYTIGWALAQVQNAGGGQIYFEPNGILDIILTDDLVLTYNNVTMYAPGGNVTFWLDRLDGHINITTANNWIFKGIYFRSLPGPINGTVIDETTSHAASLINIHSDTADKFAFLNCEFRHPSWHCLDVSRHSPSTGSHPCRVSVQNCIFWDAIQGHLIGTDLAGFAPTDYTTDTSVREIFVTFYRTIWAYNLQRNPKVLANADVDLVNCYTILRPYETEYVDYTGHTYTDLMTDAWGAAVMDGGWLRVRGCLFTSAHSGSDGLYATHILTGIGGATGRISVVDSASENSLVFETRDSGLIPALSYTLANTVVPAAGAAREAWVADLWSTAGARPDAAPAGQFIWNESVTDYPDGENILIERGHVGQWKRIDVPTEYPSVDKSSSILDSSPKSFSRTIGFVGGKSSGVALGSSTLDIANLDSNFFIAQGNSAPVNLKYIMSSSDAPLADGLILRLGGTSGNYATLKNATTLTATGVLTAGADTITLPAHGLVSGDWPVYFTSSGTLPTNVVNKQPYYAIVIDANTIKLATNYTDGMAGTVVNITSAGTGTLTAHLGNLNLPNGADLILNRSSAVTELVWDAANVQFDVITRHRIQMADVTDIPVLSSGTYTPTLTGVANCSALSVTKAQYSRNGNMVVVTARVTGTQTTASTFSRVGITLPIASVLAIGSDLIGTCNTNSTTPIGGYVNGDTVNARAEAGWVCSASSGGTFTLNVMFQYEVK